MAPTALYELGADVKEIGVTPNGFNINEESGSTYPAAMVKAVREYRADIGIALDGDADRLVICDEKGQVVDGDQIMALIAQAWSDQGRLTGGGVVATVMSNLGLERFLGARVLKLHRTQVGDRYVAEHMRAHGLNIGGEQSGHLILSDFATTGDGLLAALRVLAVLVERQRSASEVCQVFQRLPQRLKNVRFSGISPLRLESVQRDIKAAETRLNGSGRLLIRESGTEPLIRVMAEGEDEAVVLDVVDSLCAIIADAARQPASAAE